MKVERMKMMQQEQGKQIYYSSELAFTLPMTRTDFKRMNVG